MKRKACCFFLSMLPLFFVCAADSTITWQQWKQTWLRDTINTKKINSLKDSNGIRSVQVMDMRSDTSLIGLYTDKSWRTHVLVTDVSLTQVMNDKLSNGTNGKELIFVIKNLYIRTKEIYSQERGNKIFIPIPGKFYDQVLSLQSGKKLLSASEIKCAIDVFIVENDTYRALVRVDTLLRHQKYLGKAAAELIENLQNVLYQKITCAINEKSYPGRKAASKERIAEAYNNDFLVPVITDPFIKKGLFYNWEHFKKNLPDESEFRIEINKEGELILYTKSSAGIESVSSRDIYAVSDGIHVYKMGEGPLSDLYRDGRSIYWVQVADRSPKSMQLPVIAPLTSSKSKIKLIPHLIDFEDGKSY